MDLTEIYQRNSVNRAIEKGGKHTYLGDSKTIHICRAHTEAQQKVKVEIKKKLVLEF